jgi:hypothetical protein
VSREIVTIIKLSQRARGKFFRATYRKYRETKFHDSAFKDGSSDGESLSKFFGGSVAGENKRLSWKGNDRLP